MENNRSRFLLTLSHGTGDTFLSDRIESIHYEKMKLYNYTQTHVNTTWLGRGWSKITTNKKDMAYFIYNIFLSLSPLLVLGLIAAFSIINPRYQRLHSYSIGFSVAFAVYIAASLLRKQGTPWILFAISTLFVVIGMILFHYKTKARF
jgi:lipopolysaccharide export system permease protein